MTPVEKLEAAIEKLDEERNAATNGEWVLQHMFGIQDLSTVVGAGGELIVETLSPESWYPAENAQLVVTLHRTIDAQLEILQEVLAAASIEQFWPTLIYTRTALALADAILGEDAQ